MTTKFLLVVLVLSFLALIAPSHAGQTNTIPLQVSISKVERTQRWEMRGPFPGTVGFVEAKEGEEILVLYLRVKSKGSITLTGFGIIDDTGKKNEKCKTNIMGWEGDVPPAGIAIPFTIPKGLRVKKLAIRDPAMEINIPEKRP